MALETDNSYGVQRCPNMESAQSSKESLASPVDDKKDLEALPEGDGRLQVSDPAAGLTRSKNGEKPAMPTQEQQLEKDPNLVEFDGPDDPGNPKNWSVKRRTGITISMGMMTFVVTFSSSIFAVAIQPVSEEFHVSTVVSTLGVSLFLLVSLI